LSGFAAVARDVEAEFGVPAREAFATLVGELSDGRRHVALQGLCTRFGLPVRYVDEFRDRMRTHAPNLRLPAATVDVLRALRRGWRIGVLTNGLPSTQERKIAALGLERLVDAVVYAEYTGPGKPDRAAFDAIVKQLNVPAENSVFVGDNLWCDVAGARYAGLNAIWLCRSVGRTATRPYRMLADAIVDRISEVPAAAEALVYAPEWLDEESHAAYC
jgi:putative hydrolase of the HAD superfamily